MPLGLAGGGLGVDWTVSESTPDRPLATLVTLFSGLRMVSLLSSWVLTHWSTRLMTYTALLLLSLPGYLAL